VLTGVEFSLPLAVLGNPSDEIKIAVFIGSSGHNNVSNQFAGVGVLRSNLGSPGTVNLASITGNQFVTVLVPSADFDGDGDVDGRDFLAWQRGNGDADGNSVSNEDDLAIWQEQYGTSLLVAATTAVPEPSCLAMFLALLVAGGNWRTTTRRRALLSHGDL
jgi:hypothetical protein